MEKKKNLAVIELNYSPLQRRWLVFVGPGKYADLSA